MLPEVNEGEGIISHKSGSHIKFSDTEMLLEHESGAQIKFKEDGSIEIKASKFEVNEL